jgi:type II secretory pathway pseudopilin PulG
MSWRAEPEARPGFVLLEAVVALAIIGLFAIALLETTGSQLRTAAKANTLLVARSLADDRLAALRLLDYDDLDDVPDSLLEGTFPPPFEEYSWTTRVEQIDDEYDLFGAEVVVQGRGENYPIRTLIHAPGPNVAVSGSGGALFGGGDAGGFGGRGGGRAGRGGDGRGGQTDVGPPPGGRGGRGGTAGRGTAGQTGQTGGQTGRAGGARGAGS